ESGAGGALWGDFAGSFCLLLFLGILGCEGKKWRIAKRWSQCSDLNSHSKRCNNVTNTNNIIFSAIEEYHKTSKNGKCSLWLFRSWMHLYRQKRAMKEKRFGFVRFRSMTDARRAIGRLNGFVIMGNRLSVELAKYEGKRMIWKKQSRADGSDGKGKWERREGRNMKRKGYVEDEQLWKLQRSMVGVTASCSDVKAVQEQLTKVGLGEIKIRKIQCRVFLIDIPDEELYEILKQNEWAYL
ncbi:hypothetical protein Gogos_005572, partial [Gossypium gossypioides]|nr:hypothetical protein [Gossypium gossypioides]